MTAYEFWMPLALLVVAGGGGVLLVHWSQRQLHKTDKKHPAE